MAVRQHGKTNNGGEDVKRDESQTKIRRQLFPTDIVNKGKFLQTM